jgi:hypothetical protein
VRPDCITSKPGPSAIGKNHHAACVRVVDGTNDIRSAGALAESDIHKKFKDQFIGRKS